MNNETYFEEGNGIYFADVDEDGIMEQVTKEEFEKYGREKCDPFVVDKIVAKKDGTLNVFVSRPKKE